MRLPLFYAFPVFLTIGWINNSQEFQNGNSYISLNSDISSKDQIGFLYFEVEKNNLGKEQIKLVNHSVVDGKLKGSHRVLDEWWGHDDYKVSVFDINGNVVFEELIASPLHPYMEVYEDNQPSRVQVHLEKTEFQVRYPYSKEVSRVVVEQKTVTGKTILFTSNLHS